MSILGPGPPTIAEINRFLQECSVMFAIVNTKSDIVKCLPVLKFANEGLHHVADVHATPLRLSPAIDEKP